MNDVAVHENPDGSHAAMTSPHHDWVARVIHLASRFPQSAETTDRLAQLPKDNLRLLFEAGVDTAILPKSLGGAGISAQTFGRIVFEIARVCPATACIWLMNTAAAESFVMLSSAEQSAYYLAQWHGGKRFANALSEPTSGNLFLSPVQEAVVQDNGDFLLDGAKRFVSGSEWADFFLVNLRVGDVPAFFGIARDETIITHDIWDSLGMRGTRSQLVEFRGTRLAPATRLERVVSGRQSLIALGLPWLSLGIAQAAYDALIAHVQGKRIGDGQSLAHVQWVQYELADAYIRLKSARLLAEHLLSLSDAGSEQTSRTAMEAKVLANQVAKDIADLAIRVGGGLAYTRALPFERHLRDAQAGGLMAYSSELCRLFVAQSELNIDARG